MNSSRITRGQAKSNEELRREIEAFDPFTATRSLPRGESVESIEKGEDNNIKIQNKNKTLPLSIKPISGTTMAAQTIPLKDALTVVPEFNGENIPLSVFLEGCDEAKEMITAENEANLTKLIRSRLTGEARKAIYGQAFATVEQLKDFIKAIYAPSKTVHQLLGEMGNEYQKDHESVISFANRIRDLGRRIIETQRVNAGNIDVAFRNSIQDNSVECFKRGLNPEIEQRLENAQDMEHIVQKAIKAERLVEARRALRRRDNIRVEALPQHKLIKKGTYVSQIFGTKERAGEGNNFGIQPSVNCQLCNKRGHLAGDCRDRRSQINMAQLVCQICNRQGHSANQCRSGVKCQICQKLGHGARQCRFQVTGISTCQICNKPGHNANRCFQVRSTNFIQTEDPICELLPLD